MVYPYTPFVPISYYDVISQRLIEQLDTIENDEGYDYMRIGNSPELESSHADFIRTEIRPLLFSYTTEEKEVGNRYISDNPNNLYLSRMFVYLVELTKGYFNEQIKSEGESASGLPSEVNCTIIFAERLEEMIPNSVVQPEERILSIMNLSSIEMDELYECALTFFACELVVFALNKKRRMVSQYIAQKTLELLGKPSGQADIDDELIGNNKEGIFRLANLINDTRYRLQERGGDEVSSNLISISFFIAYLSDNKSVLQIGDYSKRQRLMFSLFPSLENSRFERERFGNNGFQFDAIWDRLTRNWEHDEFSFDAPARIGNKLKLKWSITRAVFELVPPPDVLGSKAQQSRTLNFSRRGFL
jgi:hypothetical protein